MWFNPIRFLEIVWILTKYGIFSGIRQHHPNRVVRTLLLGCPLCWVPLKKKSRAKQIHQALEALGPIFIKAGQQLSTRSDLLPTDILNKLQQLQEHVTPIPGKILQAEIEKTYQHSVSTLFKEFHEIPLASASLAQVHPAILKTGEDVVVKVLKPGIEKTIKQDIQIILFFAYFFDVLFFHLKRLKFKEIALEIQRVLYNELDFRLEASNASKLSRNTQKTNLLYVPKIYWPFVRKNCLVLERVYGIGINDIQTLKAKGVHLTRLAQRVIETLLRQFFQDRFFHADLHAGNFWVSVEDGADPKLIAIDFGIMGHLTRSDQLYLAKNFLAVIQQDYAEVARLHVESGWIPAEKNVIQLEMAISAICEPIFRKPLQSISFSETVLGFIQIAKKFKMQLQPQLLLMQKTLINLEGIVRQLDPNIDLWLATRPVLEQIISQELSAQKLFSKLQKAGNLWLTHLLEPTPARILAKGSQTAYFTFLVGLVVGCAACVVFLKVSVR